MNKVSQTLLSLFYILGDTLTKFDRKPTLLEWSIAAVFVIAQIAALHFFLKKKFIHNNAGWILAILFTLWTYSYDAILFQLADWNEFLAHIVYFSFFPLSFLLALRYIDKPLIRSNQIFITALCTYGALGFYNGFFKIKSFNTPKYSTISISSPDPINKKPNIYLFLLDAYSGEESLKKNLGFDNFTFTDSLKQKRFNYFPNSRSNYTSTIYSMSSFFKVDTLSNQQIEAASEKENRKKLNELLDIMTNKNVLITSLEQHGYSIYNYSLFNLNGHPPIYPRLFYVDWNSFWKSSIGKTFYGKAYNYLAKREWIRDFALRPEYVERQIFDDADSIVISNRVTKPKFVYVHSLAIHKPFFYINEKTSADLSGEKDRKYLSALISLNKRLLKTINLIQKNDKNAIIFLVSDHGFLFDKANEAYQKYNFTAINYGDNRVDTIPSNTLLSLVDCSKILYNLINSKEVN